MMRTSLCSFLLCAAGVLTNADASPQSTIWTVLAFDARGDGREPSAPDAAQLSYRFDRSADVLWFRLSTFGPLDFDAITVRFGIDSAGAHGAKERWPGVRNTTFAFDRLATVTATRTASGYAADISIRNAEAVTGEQPSHGLVRDGYLRIDADAIVVGIERGRLTDARTLRLVAAIGSSGDANDDIPNLDAAVLDLTAPRPSRGLREIDTARNNLILAGDDRTPSSEHAAAAVRSGHGALPLILVPGIYSGNSAFDRFIERNAARYTFHTVTPRGLNGTAPAPMPPAATSYGELTWTRMLAHDILDLIAAQRLDKPIIVAHGFPGSLAAEALALTNPGLLGGIVELASMAVQPYPSLRSGQEATPAERVAFVDDGWARQWFKYVTPETWESNNYPREMFLNDQIAAERVRQQVEAVPLPVKIRYLVEFMASDNRPSFAALPIPVLVMKPGFNPTLLADPAFAWFKTSFDEGWKPYPSNPAVEFHAIPDGRALLLDDQPGPADRAIHAFVERVRVMRGGTPMAR